MFKQDPQRGGKVKCRAHILPFDSTNNRPAGLHTKKDITEEASINRGKGMTNF